jgi:hypothetical protein
MPSPASSARMASVRAERAFFTVTYQPTRGPLVSPAADEMFTIRPPSPAARMCGTAR